MKNPEFEGKSLVRPTTRSAAIHEAGHAAWNWFFGFQFKEVKLISGGGICIGYEIEYIEETCNGRYSDNGHIRFIITQCINYLAGHATAFLSQKRNVARRMNEIIDATNIYTEDTDLKFARDWAEETWDDWLYVLHLLVAPTLRIIRTPAIRRSCNQLALRLMNKKEIKYEEVLEIFSEAHAAFNSTINSVPADVVNFWQWPEILEVSSAKVI